MAEVAEVAAPPVLEDSCMVAAAGAAAEESTWGTSQMGGGDVGTQEAPMTLALDEETQRGTCVETCMSLGLEEEEEAEGAAAATAVEETATVAKSKVREVALHSSLL